MTKSSPVFYAQQDLNPDWAEYNAMQVARSFAPDQLEQESVAALAVTDLSCLQRFGVKGPQAQQWLTSKSIKTPNLPNSWLQDKQHLVLRLGMSEFMVEPQPESKLYQQLDLTNSKGVYQILRDDAAIMLTGNKVLTMFSELCRLDLQRQLAKEQVCMTQIADISATIICQTIDNETVYRIWCDGTYGSYMWKVLAQLAKELGGGAVGLNNSKWPLQV